MFYVYVLQSEKDVSKKNRGQFKERTLKKWWGEESPDFRGQGAP